MAKRPYQDTWRDGKLVAKGRRDCEGRYQAIRQLLDEHQPASVADIGGWDGYFSRRIAEAFDARVTLVEQRNVPDLDGAGITHRKMVVDADNVEQIGRHDVILALAVLHHIPQWEAVYERLRTLCDLLIVESADPAEAAEGRKLTPTLVATRPQIAPVFERTVADGARFHTTSGPNGVDRPLLAIHNSWSGTAEDGSGRAAPYMADCDEGHWNPLGYQPHPGTLNVRVGADGREWVSRLPRPIDRSTEKLPGPYWPVTINGVDGHVRLSRSKVTVECVAPQPLRDTLGIVNGDTVTVAPR